MRVGEGKKEVYILAILLIFAFAIASPVSGQFAIEQIPIRGNFTYMEPDNLTRGSALEALMNSQEEIRAMQGYNLTANYVSDLLLKAKRAYIGEKYSYLLEDLEKEEDRRKISYLESLLEVAHATPDYEVENVNLSKVFMLTQLITYRKNQAYRILDSFPLVEDKERLFREQDVNTSAGMELLLLAKTSFREERYDEAEKYVEMANDQLDRSFLEYRRLKSIIFLGRNFLLRNWWQILLVIAVLIITVPPIAKRARVSIARGKIERLKLEYESLTESLKEAQKERFVSMTITDKAYQARADVFLERMTKIKHTIPVLEAIVKGEISEKAEKKPEKTEKPQIKRPEAPAIKGMARKGVIESALKKLAIRDLASRIRVLGKNSYSNMRGFSSRALFSMRKLDIAVYGRTKKTFRKVADLVSKIYPKKPKAEVKEKVREEAKAEEIMVKKAAVKKIPVQKKILLKPYAVKVAKLIKDSSVKLGEYGSRALTRSRELDIIVYGKIKNNLRKARELLSKYPAKPKVMKKKMEAEKKEEMIEIIEEPQPEFLPGIEEKVEEEAAKPKVSRKPLVKPGKALSEAYQRTASQLRGSALKALDYSRKLDQKAYGYLKSFITGIKSIRPSKGRKEEIRKEEEKPKEKIRWVDVKKDVAERQRKETLIKISCQAKSNEEEDGSGKEGRDDRDYRRTTARIPAKSRREEGGRGNKAKS